MHLSCCFSLLISSNKDKQLLSLTEYALIWQRKRTLWIVVPFICIHIKLEQSVHFYFTCAQSNPCGEWVWAPTQKTTQISPYCDRSTWNLLLFLLLSLLQRAKYDALSTYSTPVRKWLKHCTGSLNKYIYSNTVPVTICVYGFVLIKYHNILLGWLLALVLNIYTIKFFIK